MEAIVSEWSTEVKIIKEEAEKKFIKLVEASDLPEHERVIAMEEWYQAHPPAAGGGRRGENELESRN